MIHQIRHTKLARARRRQQSTNRALTVRWRTRCGAWSSTLLKAWWWRTRFTPGTRTSFQGGPGMSYFCVSALAPLTVRKLKGLKMSTHVQHHDITFSFSHKWQLIFFKYFPIYSLQVENYSAFVQLKLFKWNAFDCISDFIVLTIISILICPVCCTSSSPGIRMKCWQRTGRNFGCFSPSSHGSTRSRERSWLRSIPGSNSTLSHRK